MNTKVTVENDVHCRNAWSPLLQQKKRTSHSKYAATYIHKDSAQVTHISGLIQKSQVFTQCQSIISIKTQTPTVYLLEEPCSFAL